jgi:hypothetical protein
MSNNISGGGRSRNTLSSVDFYRRVPKDLTEVRRHADTHCGCIAMIVCTPFYVKMYGEILSHESFVGTSLPQCYPQNVGDDTGSCHVNVCHWNYGYSIYQ